MILASIYASIALACAIAWCLGYVQGQDAAARRIPDDDEPFGDVPSIPHHYGDNR